MDALDTDVLRILNPYCATEASNAVILAAAKEAFRNDDLHGHVKGRHDWDSIPFEGQRAYRSLVVTVLNAAARESAIWGGAGDGAGGEL